MLTFAVHNRHSPPAEKRHSRDAVLLPKRMRAHGLDPNWFSLAEPFMFSKLRSTCTTCKKFKRCALDLSKDGFDPGRPGWCDYCPNGATLNFHRAIVNFYWRAEQS
jgi:hypothetical protein